MIPPEYLHDSATILILVLLEGLLSADNALVLALMVRHLPVEQRGKALRYGMLGAFVFRAVGVALARFLIELWYLKALGAAYLCFICGKFLYDRFQGAESESDAMAAAAKLAGLWKTVVLVELTDIIFSIDSIIAAVGMSPKLYIVYIGGMLGIITMRFVAGYFLKLLDRFPALETSAYLLVGWIGVKLGVEVAYYLANPEHVEAARKAGQLYEHSMPVWLFWGVMALIFISAFFIKKKPKT